MPLLIGYIHENQGSVAPEVVEYTMDDEISARLTFLTII